MFAGRIAVFVAVIAWCSALAADSYRASIEKWRQEREARLKSESGWLTVAGLFWLTEGPNSVGTDSAGDIVLPAGSAPAKAGVFELRKGKTLLTSAPNVTFTHKGNPVRWIEMQPDQPGPPDVVELGRLSMNVIKRGNRFAIRLRDKHAAARTQFTGLRWYPIGERYRIVARFVPYNPPKQIPIPNVTGETEWNTCPGYVVFTIGGRELRLEPVEETPGELFFIFKDLTSRKETYPAGRFLYTQAPKDGRLVLDFNKAYNPPCAFTPFATCPLPPKQNQLDVAIPAGELRYGAGKH